MVGISPITTARLRKICNPNKVLMPKARNFPKSSSVSKATEKARHRKPANRAITVRVPTKPNSSARMEKMKSVWASGRKNSFRRLSPKPTPNQPPLPMAR